MKSINSCFYTYETYGIIFRINILFISKLIFFNPSLNKNDIKGKNKVKGSFGSRIAEHFKSLDLYGKIIMLTNEGNEKFKTHIGAMI